MKSHFLMVAAMIGLLTCNCGVDAVQQKQDYVETTERRLQNVSLRIEGLEHLHKETLESGMTADPELTQALSELGRKQEVARKELAELKGSGIANWKVVRNSMDTLLQDLERSCEIASFMLEEAWHEMQETGVTPDYLLVDLSPDTKRYGEFQSRRAFMT